MPNSRHVFAPLFRHREANSSPIEDDENKENVDPHQLPPHQQQQQHNNVAEQQHPLNDDDDEAEGVVDDDEMPADADHDTGIDSESFSEMSEIQID